MKLAMIGVDFHTADIGFREQVSLSQSAAKNALLSLKKIGGVVLLSTCNRTELFLATEESISGEGLLQLFAGSMGVEVDILRGHCYIKRNDKMIQYLFELTCGLHSMILGEDQIITQVKEALEASLAVQAGNSLLNTLFRHGVTCAKKAKSLVNIKNVSPSIVSGAMALAESRVPDGNVLVIGNGEIGRMAAQAFVEKGYSVRMTLRTYRHGAVFVPEGVSTVEYERREEAVAWADVVVSATKSPHFTLTREMLERTEKLPTLLFDLALPRDIEPAVKGMEQVVCYDVDDIGKRHQYRDEEAIKEIQSIINEQIGKFQDWCNYHENGQREAVAR